MDLSDEGTRVLLFGYSRQIQKEIQHIIPDTVIIICLSYYYINEYFADAPGDYSVDKTGQIIEKVNNVLNRSSCYGFKEIKSLNAGIYTWKFRLNGKYTSMYIGITSKYEKLKEDFWNMYDGYNYCITSTGRKKSCGKGSDYYTNGYAAGDIIKMELNLNKKTLKYYKNDHDQGVAYSNIKCGELINYKMAISFLHKKSKLTLLNFAIS